MKKTFLKADTINWSYKLYEIPEIVNETKPSNKLDKLLERYNQALLKETQLTKKENDSFMTALALTG